MGDARLPPWVREVGTTTVSGGVQGLEVAMLCRGGKAEPELVPNILVLPKKKWGRGVVIVGPRTSRCGTLTLTKVLPEVQVRRWRRLSGRRFMTKSGSYSSLTTPTPPCTR